MTTRAGVYCRISSDKDETKIGVDQQERDCRKLCKQRGWIVVDPYVDNDITAADPKKRRPEYQRLLRDISAGRIDAVVVWDEDRLHRQPAELEEFVKVCEAAGMSTLASIGGDTDLNNEDALFTLRIKGLLAAKEIAKMKRRIRRRKLEHAEKGIPSGGMRAFGFEDGNLVIREPEAILIRQAASDILAGRTNYSIIKEWTEAGVLTARGNQWSQQAFRTTMIGPRIAGKRQHGKDAKGLPIVMRDDNGQDVVAVWPAILDEGTWLAVRGKLLDPSRQQAPPSRDYPLRGILTCAICGALLKAQPAEKRRMYTCKKETGGCGKVYVSGDRIEEYVFGLLLPLADSPALRDIIRAEESHDLEELKKLVSEKTKLETKLVTFAGYLADETWDKPTYLREKRKVEAAKDEIESRISSMHIQSALDRLGGQVQEQWADMSADDKRLILKSLVTVIRVTPAIRRGSNVFDSRRVEIVYRFDAIAKVAKSEGKVRLGGGYVTIKPDWKIKAAS